MNKSTDKPPTPEERRAGRKLAEALDSFGITKTNFSRVLAEEEGLTSGYQLVKNWCNGRGFSAINRKKCIRLLKLPVDYFDDPKAPAPTVSPRTRSTALGALLESGRPLKRFTVEGLLALDKANDYPDHAWETFAAVHEGIAATVESGRSSSIVRLVPPTKPTRSKPKR